MLVEWNFIPNRIRAVGKRRKGWQPRQPAQSGSETLADCSAKSVRIVDCDLRFQDVLATLAIEREFAVFVGQRFQQVTRDSCSAPRAARLI